MKYENAHLLMGIDASKEISLLEYGLLIAPYIKDGHTDEYFCVYSIGNDHFDTGYKRENEINELVNGNEWASNEDVDEFLSFAGDGMSKEEYLKLPMVQKLYDCLNYWGHENIMGSVYSEGISIERAKELYL